MYHWEFTDWPKFTWQTSAFDYRISAYLGGVTDLVRKLRLLSAPEREAFTQERMVEEAATTSSIEGEIMSRTDLMSSIKNNLNLGQGYVHVKDQRAKSIAQIIVLNRSTFREPLTENALKYWHELLLNWDRRPNTIGDYRSGGQPMQIISGPLYRPTVHYEAPPSGRVKAEMKQLIAYCQTPRPAVFDQIVAAGVAHSWFESIHPFEDGNGRVGRAIIEKLLSQSLSEFVPFSISYAIAQRQREYYQALKDSQHSLDITPWLLFYTECLNDGVAYADRLVTFTLGKHAYLKQYHDQLSPTQLKAINKMFEAGPDGFRGGMTARKYMSINRTSRATATRALTELADIGALQKQGAGRSVHYVLP